MNKEGFRKQGVGVDAEAVISPVALSAAPVICRVVGIGASAGGLEAFTRLLEHLPVTTGMAYVFVQHLDPAHPSLLPGLLARVTLMPVREVINGMPVEPNQVYVLPPNATLTFEQGIFTLGPLISLNGQRLAIDHFLRSLAHECRSQAIGVLLSGTASDGTEGLRAIKAGGGVTFAQDVHSAAFPHMPQSAIATGAVDYVLSPEEIATELIRLSHFPAFQEASPPESHAASPLSELPDDEEQVFISVLHMLRSRTGVDFLSYKPATLKRRILHRMGTLRIADLAEYENYLHIHAAESEALSQEMLIPVTRFFRDEAVFANLVHHAFPALVQHLAPGATLRIWVPGCSTGEEVYSLAICLLEFLEERSLAPPIQFFATDISAPVLAHARAGIYPSSALTGISPERRERFFTPLDLARGSYRVSKALRERCVFAGHNLAKDPPFSHLDLISCRNVLIYLGANLQQKVIQTFHYALNPQGLLLLGTSESIDPLSRLFRRVEHGQKLYCKKVTGGTLLPGLMYSEAPVEKQFLREGETFMPGEKRVGWDILQEADRLLLTNYTPASVVIDANQEILQVRGQTSLYLELAAGRANLNLLKMARPGLRLSLRAAIHMARKENRRVTKEGVQVRAFDKTSEVRLSVIPLKGPPAEPHFLVLFEEMTAQDRNDLQETPGSQAGSIGKRPASERRIAAIEQELAETKGEMTALLEERDAANEEFQTANEEIRTSNEELQSTNEELETSREELQIINEELITTNQELHTRNEQVKEAQDYAEAIVETVREPLIVLSEDLRVQRANVAFYQCFHVTPQETEGHTLDELGDGQWNSPHLRTLLEQVLTTQQSFRDFEVAHRFPRIGKRTMLLNARRIVREYEQVKDHLLLLAMEDITERRQAERQQEALLGMVSHELKSPLTSASLTAQLLSRLFEQEGFVQGFPYVRRLSEQHLRLDHLINDLLDATAIEAGTLRLSPALFAINELVQEVIEQLMQMYPKRRLLSEKTGTIAVYADRERTGQVLTNLLSNAIKYGSETEPVFVHVLVAQEEVTVQVQDCGNGIPLEHQTRVFERFYRVPTGALHKESAGLGLGLYLTAQIVRQQGGQIHVESTEEVGSTFSFTLPRRGAS
jgi:two-component system, chemotaxis family, CheB/CheR fusion protein